MADVPGKYATTVTSSPSKPQLISIPRRYANIMPSLKGPSLDEKQTATSDWLPATPPYTPASPVGLGIHSPGHCQQDKEEEIFRRIKARATWSTAKTSLASSTHNSTDATSVRYGHPISNPTTRPENPRPLASPAFHLSEITMWILTELEASLACTSPVKLSLDTPVIQQIRLPSEQRKIPQPVKPTIPLSHFSTYKGPLSSHQPAGHCIISSAPRTSSVRMAACQKIFPNASFSVQSSLQATYLALHHVSDIYLPFPFPAGAASDTSRVGNDPTSIPDMPHIPSKARAMLGLQPAVASRPCLPLSWFHPRSMSWAQRVDNLEVGLEKEVRRLIGECEGWEVKDEEVLVTALGELVMTGESNSNYVNMRMKDTSFEHLTSSASEHSQ